jgi:hypothetical protein
MLNTYRMKAQYSKQTDVPGRLSTIDKRGSSWPLPFGLLTADSGLLLIAFAGWEALRASSQTLLYSCGVILCFAGLVLVWVGTTKAGAVQRGTGLPSYSNWSSIFDVARQGENLAPTS